MTIAQAILESNAKGRDGLWHWGGSSLFRLAHNPFGIKYVHRQGEEDYGELERETHEEIDGRDQVVRAGFQIFPDLKAAFLTHATLFWRLNRYAPAIVVVTDWRKFALALGPRTNLRDAEHCGYATDPAYGPKLIGLIERYRLDDRRLLGWIATGKDPGAEVQKGT